MSRALINAAGAALQAIRADGEADLIVSFGAHAPSPGCPTNGHISVTIRRGGRHGTYDEVTTNAVHLDDAILMARARLNDIAAKRKAEKAKEMVA